MHAGRRDSVKSFKINLKHSRTATSNLVQLINQQNVDMTFIQEPYTINNKLAGLPKSYKVYKSGDGRKGTALIIKVVRVDVTLIIELSNEDCVVEVRSEAVRIYSVNMFFDTRKGIEEVIRQLEELMDYTKDTV